MLGDLSHVSKIYIICGRTDMRKSIDGLMTIIRDTYNMDPFANALYLFCGRKSDRLKALHFDSTGFVILYEVDYYSRKTPDEPYTSVPSKSFLNNSSSWYYRLFKKSGIFACSLSVSSL